MELIELLPVEAWEALEDEIRARSGLSTSIFNVEGIRITDNQTWPNRLCPAIKADPKGQSFICATAHMNIALMAKANRQGVFEGCDAGLIKLVVPIMVGDAYLGAVGACGLLLDDDEVDDFLVTKITDLDETTIQELSQGIGSISTEEAEVLKGYIEARVEEIVSAYRARSGGN